MGDHYDPETRTLIRVRIDDAAQAERRVTTLMGDKVEPRRKWIERHVQFTLEEDGSILDRKDGETEISPSISNEVLDEEKKKKLNGKMQRQKKSVYSI